MLLDVLENRAKQVYVGLRERVRELYGGVIRDARVLDAIAWLVSRAELMDEPYFPVTVKSLGIMGSALWKTSVGDVDVVVEADENSLGVKFRLLEKKIWRAREIVNMGLEECYRCRSRELIKYIAEELRMYGFDDVELMWLSLIPRKYITDLLYFPEALEKVVYGFLRDGWSRVLIEFHDAEDRRSEGFPYLVFWVRGKGLLPITREDVEKYIEQAREHLRRKMNEKYGHLRSLGGRCIRRGDHIAEILDTVYNRLLKLYWEAEKRGNLNDMSRYSKELSLIGNLYGHEWSTLHEAVMALRKNLLSAKMRRYAIEVEEMIKQELDRILPKYIEETLERVAETLRVYRVMVIVDKHYGELRADIMVEKPNGEVVDLKYLDMDSDAREAVKKLSRLSIDYCIPIRYAGQFKTMKARLDIACFV